MNLALIYDSPVAIQIHLALALTAFLWGGVILARPKGTALHKTMGRIWVAAMLIVAISSFWIHELNIWRGLSPIHVLSVVVLINLPYAIWAIRTGRVAAHAITMISLYVFALITAGIFTLVPGRLLARALFGWD